MLLYKYTYLKNKMLFELSSATKISFCGVSSKQSNGFMLYATVGSSTDSLICVTLFTTVEFISCGLDRFLKSKTVQSLKYVYYDIYKFMYHLLTISRYSLLTLNQIRLHLCCVGDSIQSICCLSRRDTLNVVIN